jgi:hypothetical protein
VQLYLRWVYVSNPEMKRSVMAWIAWDTTSVTCSKKIICLDFLVTFLSKKKVTRVWGGNPKNKIFVLLLFIWVNVNQSFLLK